MSSIEPRPSANAPYIETWNEVLTPKWLRFRHLLSGNGQVHSDLAYPRMNIRRGQRVLDVACGFGENALELADRVGPLGTVLGIDCTREFIEVARREAEAAGMTNLEYRVDDIETAELPSAAFDAAVSRFGIMFCASPVRALRAIRSALVPGGQLGLLAWRSPATTRAGASPSKSRSGICQRRARKRRSADPGCSHWPVARPTEGDAGRRVRGHSDPTARRRAVRRAHAGRSRRLPDDSSDRPAM